MSFFEIGVFQPKTKENVGSLWRSAYQMGAAGIFIIGPRFKVQASDTYKSYRQIPLREYATFEEFQANRPYSAQLVAVEIGGERLANYKHPKTAVYLLGSEDNGLPPAILESCNSLVSLESAGPVSYNVAVAGGIVMYHRTFLAG